MRACPLAYRLVNRAFLSWISRSVSTAVMQQEMAIHAQKLIHRLVSHQSQKRIVTEGAIAMTVNTVNGLSGGIEDQLQLRFPFLKHFLGGKPVIDNARSYYEFFDMVLGIANNPAVPIDGAPGTVLMAHAHLHIGAVTGFNRLFCSPPRQFMVVRVQVSQDVRAVQLLQLITEVLLIGWTGIEDTAAWIRNSNKFISIFRNGPEQRLALLHGFLSGLDLGNILNLGDHLPGGAVAPLYQRYRQ